MHRLYDCLYRDEYPDCNNLTGGGRCIAVNLEKPFEHGCPFYMAASETAPNDRVYHAGAWWTKDGRQLC